LAEHTISVRRMVDVLVPFLGPLEDDPLLGAELAALLEPVHAELPAAALAALREADPAAVPALLGRGSGLTPTGDDVLAGWLVACRATGLHATDVRTAVCSLAPVRTTTVSATLLE